jgi:hypothetical protein
MMIELYSERTVLAACAQLETGRVLLEERRV